MTEHPDIFTARHREAMQELDATPLDRANFDPPLMRLMRAVGLRVRPPHYRPAASNAVLFGAAFALLWGVLMWAVLVPLAGIPGGVIAVLALVAGAAYGSWMAQGIRREAAEAGLRDWHDLADGHSPG